MARRQHTHSTKASFDEFFSAFSKSVRADVRLENSELVVSYSGGLLNDALAANGDTATHSVNVSANPRPATRPSVMVAQLPQLNSQQSQGVREATDAGESQETPLPSHLAALTALQASDGSWCFDDKFRFVVHDVASPPPDGISPKLWATALVVTIFRQFPAYFTQLEPIYEKAMLHVDENVLHVVKDHVDTTPEVLERIRPYQNDQAKRIRERLAREAATKRAEEDAEERRIALEREKIIAISKYSMAKAKRLPLKAQELMVSTLTSQVQAIFPAKHKPPAKMRPAEMQIRAGDVVECCWRRVDGSKRPKVHNQWWLCLVAAANLDRKSIIIQFLVDPYEREQNVRARYLRLTTDDAQNRRSAALGSLKETWEKPLPIDSELMRLQEIHEKCKWRKPWEVRSLPSLPIAHASEEEPSNRPRSSVSTRTRLTAAALEAIDNRHVEHDAVLEDLYQRAVGAALAYDKVYAQIHPIFMRAIKHYTSAMLFSERYHAFDAFLDVAVQLVTQTVTALEHIQAWTREPSTASGATRMVRMFVWGGQDFVVALVRSLDFVGSKKPAKEWYGEDFAFSLNPFLMVTSIRDLVQERGFQFTDKFAPIEAENALRTALRMQRENAKDEAAPQEISPWWPQARYDAELLGRIKKAEIFVLDYLRFVGVLC